MSPNQISCTRSAMTELALIAGVVVVSIATLLPMIPQGDRISSVKRPVQKLRHQPLVSHRAATPVRGANL